MTSNSSAPGNLPLNPPSYEEHSRDYAVRGNNINVNSSATASDNVNKPIPTTSSTTRDSGNNCFL